MLRLWNYLRYSLFGGKRSTKYYASRPPLRLMKLERRRVLSADFALGATSLLLDNFDGDSFDSDFGETLLVSQTADQYEFTLSQGDWNATEDLPPDVVEVNGNVLAIDKALIDDLSGGIQIVGDLDSPVDVSLGTLDMQAMSGPLSIVDARSVGQAEPNLGPTLRALTVDVPTDRPGLVLSSFNFAGDLEVSALGPIIDQPGTVINVTGNATFTSRASTLDTTAIDGIGNTDGGILLVDQPGDRLNVGGLATFIAEADLGDSSGPADRYDIGVGNFVSSSTAFGTDGGRANFGSLAVIGENAAIYEHSSTTIVTIDANHFDLITAGEMVDAEDATIDITGDARLISTREFLAADFNSDRVVDTVDFDIWKAGFGTTDATLADGDANGDGTVNAADYAMWRDSLGQTADDGGIRLTNAERILVDGQLRLTATIDGTPTDNATDRYEINLSETPLIELGSLHFTGGQVTVFEDNATLLTGKAIKPGEDINQSFATSLTINSDGSITDDDTAYVSVDNLARFESTTSEAITLNDLYEFGQFSFDGGDVTLVEGGTDVDPAIGTDLAGTNQASKLDIKSTGAITDAVATSTNVTGNAKFDSNGQAITLDALNEFGTLTFDGGAVAITEQSIGSDPTPGTVFSGVSDAASLDLASNGSITDDGTASVNVTGNAKLDSTTDSAITLDGLVEFGSLTFDAGAVTIIETSIGTDANPGTIFAGDSNAASIDLDSNGSITDEATATSVNIVGNAKLNSTTDSAITLNGLVEFGSLTFDAGAVTIVETSIGTDANRGTVFAGVSDAASLDLVSNGAITDATGSSVNVTGNAKLNSTNDAAIILNSLVEFGSLTFDAGDVTITETSIGTDANPGTIFSGLSDAASLDLTSNGAITDDGTASVNVNGNAKFDSTDDSVITLDDLYEFGSITFDGGAVTIVETSIGIDNSPGTLLTGSSDATSLDLVSNGDIVDDGAAVTLIRGPGTFLTTGTIVLADAGTANSLIVEGAASFTAGTGEDIYIGVVEGESTPADANAQLGSLQFNAPGGNVRVALDGPVSSSSAATIALSQTSQAQSAVLDTQATGDLIDQPGSEVELKGTPTQPAFAELRAANHDVVLGDSGSRFTVETPVLFVANNYLAVAGENVSIAAESALNLRTSLNETPHAGSFFLQTTGSIAQVGGNTGLRPLTADRIALASLDGAVLFSQLDLTSVVDTEDSPSNLSLYAGGAESYTSVLAARTEFPQVEILGGDELQYLPIQLDATPATLARTDGSGLNDNDTVTADSRIADPGEQGDRFSVVAVVQGDAKVGIVKDATGAQADRVGVLIADATGNAFLRTLPTPGDVLPEIDDPPPGDGDEGFGEGPFAAIATTTTGGGLQPGEAGNLVFSSRGIPSEVFSEDVFSASSLATATTTVVQLVSGVFTAIAAGSLTIDTNNPDQAGETLQTTRLTSNTGTVTSVAGYTGTDFVPTDMGPEAVAAPKQGPRVLLDLPTEESNAATTGLVRPREVADQTLFEQRITLAVGSRGEDNLVVEFEWADVANRRDMARIDPEIDPLADMRANPLTEEVEGTIPNPDLAYAPQPLDAANWVGVESAAGELLEQSSDSELTYRTVTARHDYSNEFIRTNTLVRFLPTTVRVYNDPSINLFAQNGTQQLNANQLVVQPRVINFEVGNSDFNQSIERPLTPVVESTPLPRLEQTVAQQSSGFNDLQGVIASDVEVILYGKVDPNDPEEWATDVPGETWPQQWEDVEGDYPEKIKEQVNDSPSSEGRYRIVTETPRGQLLLEQWIKGDVNDVEADAIESEVELNDELEAEPEIKANQPADQPDQQPGEQPGEQRPNDERQLNNPAEPMPQPPQEEVTPAPLFDFEAKADSLHSETNNAGVGSVVLLATLGQQVSQASRGKRGPQQASSAQPAQPIADSEQDYSSSARRLRRMLGMLGG